MWPAATTDEALLAPAWAEASRCGRCQELSNRPRGSWRTLSLAGRAVVVEESTHSEFRVLSCPVSAVQLLLVLVALLTYASAVRFQLDLQLVLDL